MPSNWLSRATNRTSTRIRLAGCLLMLFGLEANHSDAAPVRIMPLGDSITRGTNDTNYPNGDIPGGYRRELGVRLANAAVDFDFVGAKSDNAAPGMDPDHNGNNGFRTDELLSILPGLLVVDPDVVLLMAGTNDVLQAVPTTTAVNHLENLIRQITGDDPDRRLYVATLPPITQSWNGQSATQLSAKVNLYNEEVRSLVASQTSQGRKVHLVDMNAMIVLTGETPAGNFFQPGDGLHPGQAGYDQLGNLWFEAITADGPLLDPPAQGLPARPLNLAVSVVSPSRINLTWTDSAENETGYRVFSRRLSSGVWQEIALLPSNSQGHVVTGLANGLESYGFAVAAVNANGSSPWSQVVFSPAPEDRAHLKPATASSVFNNSPNYSAAKGNDGRPDTIWASGSGTNHYWQVDLQDEHHLQLLKFVTRQDNDVADHRRNFQIRVSNDPAFASYTVLSTQGGTPLPFKAVLSQDLSGLQGYRYLRVVKTDNTSFAFTLMQAYGVVETQVPAAPGGLAVSYSGDTRVRLNWQVNSMNESGFKLERKTLPSGSFAQIAMVPAGVASFTDASVVPETGYVYRISAFNESGASASSNEVTATTAATDSYQQWTASYPEFAALPESERAPLADANGDGFPNLLAYAAGADPVRNLVADFLSGLETHPDGEWYFRYRRNKNAADVIHEVLSNGDLAGTEWSPVNASPAVAVDLPGEPGVEEVRVPVFPPAGQSRCFFKLKVTKP